MEIHGTGSALFSCSHDAFGFFFLSGWKIEDAFVFFFSFKLSSSAVEFESVEFSSSTTAPEKLPFSAATRILPVFLRRSTEDADVNGGRGSRSGSEAVVISEGVGEDGSVCTRSSVDLSIRRGGASSALAALFSSWLLLGRVSCGGSDGLLSPTTNDTAPGPPDVPPASAVGEEESVNSSASSSVSSSRANLWEEVPLDLVVAPRGSVLGRSGHRRLNSDATLDTEPALIP